MGSKLCHFSLQLSDRYEISSEEWPPILQVWTYECINKRNKYVLLSSAAKDFFINHNTDFPFMLCYQLAHPNKCVMYAISAYVQTLLKDSCYHMVNLFNSAVSI